MTAAGYTICPIGCGREHRKDDPHPLHDAEWLLQQYTRLVTLESEIHRQAAVLSNYINGDPRPVLTQHEMDDAVCSHEPEHGHPPHLPLFFHSRCHPRDGLNASYVNGKLYMACKVCDALVATVLVEDPGMRTIDAATDDIIRETALPAEKLHCSSCLRKREVIRFAVAMGPQDLQFGGLRPRAIWLCWECLASAMAELAPVYAHGLPSEPKEVPSPGEHIREYMERDELTVNSASARLGISKIDLNRLLDGDLEITEELATALEKTFGRPAHFWVALGKNYRDWLARKSEEA